MKNKKEIIAFLPMRKGSQRIKIKILKNLLILKRFNFYKNISTLKSKRDW